MYLVSGRQLRFYINHVIGYNRLILILILAGVHIKHMFAIFSSGNASAYKLTGIYMCVQPIMYCHRFIDTILMCSFKDFYPVNFVANMLISYW